MDGSRLTHEEWYEEMLFDEGKGLHNGEDNENNKAEVMLGGCTSKGGGATEKQLFHFDMACLHEGFKLARLDFNTIYKLYKNPAKLSMIILRKRQLVRSNQRLAADDARRFDTVGFSDTTTILPSTFLPKMEALVQLAGFTGTNDRTSFIEKSNFEKHADAIVALCREIAPLCHQRIERKRAGKKWINAKTAMTSLCNKKLGLQLHDVGTRHKPKWKLVQAMESCIAAFEIDDKTDAHVDQSN